VIRPSIILEEERAREGTRERYWAPFDLTRGTTRQANQETRVTLDQKGQAGIDIDANKLFWSRRISSSWPAKSIFDVVPAGRYLLRIEIEMPEGHILVSREVLIAVE
jgi:hypothetical protein